MSVPETPSTERDSGTAGVAVLGASVYSMLWQMPVERAIGVIAEAGFDGIELLATVPHLSPSTCTVDDRRKVRAAIDGAGLELLAVNAPTLDVNLAAVEPRLREAAVEYYAAVIDVASDLGAPRVVISPGRVHPLQAPPIDEIRRISVGSIDTLAARAERRGVLITLENLPYGLFDRVADLQWLIEQVSSPSLAVTFDVANAHGIEPVADALESLGRTLSLIQVSDSTRAQWMHAEVGSGEIDFAQCWPQVTATGVPVVLEITQPAGVEPLVRSRQALAALQP